MGARRIEEPDDDDDDPLTADDVLLLEVVPLELRVGYGKVLLVVLSRYKSVVGMLEHSPMGLS